MAAKKGLPGRGPGFELVFDRPLAEYAFIEVAGCVELSRWRP